MNEAHPKLTVLRQDIFDILLNCKKPMTAYAILALLKQKRPNAEPPTVYRVLDYLIKHHKVHRIESQNAFVCCTDAVNPQEPHKSILLFCHDCQKSFEFKDSQISSALHQFVQKHHLQIDDSLIEFKGRCQSCVNIVADSG